MVKREVNALTETADGSQAAVNAIYDYIRSQRKHIAEHPGLLQAIQDFEAWYQDISDIQWSLAPATLVDPAKRHRQAVNDALGVELPEDYVPADAPQTPPPETTSTVSTVTVAIVAAGLGYLLLKAL